jgi:GDPmannose 4,6-dehydratase
MEPKVALISGITGQDGSYLAEYLLDLNYTVIGLHRRSSSYNLTRLENINNHRYKFKLEEFDLTDSNDCYSIINQYKPTEFYNLAAQSHVATSFKQPSTTLDINTKGVVNILEAIRQVSPSTKFYQASTSEMFGSNYTEDAESGCKFQNEKTAFSPRSPYAVAKLASHQILQVYRDAYNIFACSGILFNHESPRRGENFVTRKITNYIGKLVGGIIPPSEKLKLGNLEAKRDWGHAKDYVTAMYLMLQQNNPQDFVISTGETHTVQEFLEKAFNIINLDWRNHVETDPALYRPCEVDYLKGDSTLARTVLGWKPVVSFNDLVAEMVFSDIGLYKNETQF